MYSITNTANYELNIEYMECYENTTKEARYPYFKVGPAATNYTLAISDRINTNDRDGMKDGNGMPFSTFDVDNDSGTSKCAVKRHSAWWFEGCVGMANLNGKLDRCNETSLKSVYWYGRREGLVGITFVEMKIRRKS
ncbi:ficolin-1-like [Ciona intestinalis]